MSCYSPVYDGWSIIGFKDSTGLIIWFIIRMQVQKVRRPPALLRPLIQLRLRNAPDVGNKDFSAKVPVFRTKSPSTPEPAIPQKPKNSANRWYIRARRHLANIIGRQTFWHNNRGKDKPPGISSRYNR